MYLDDSINGQGTYQQSGDACKIIISDLEKSGFVINRSKSDLVPTQTGKWLGLIVDTKNAFFVPQNKARNFLRKIDLLLRQKLCSAKQLSKIAGHLSSMHLALGPMVWLFTRHMYRQIESRYTWHAPIQLSTETIDQLLFWKQNFAKINCYSFKPNPTTTKILFTDASESGYGGFSCSRFSEIICCGKFNFQEKLTSSTNRELLAAKYVIKSFGNQLSGESIQLNIDNINASRILTIGSPKLHLHQLAIDIFKLCLKNDIKLVPKWIPRDLNSKADQFSKLVDTDNWSIDNVNFNELNKRFGPFTIDSFADDENKKVHRFNSKYHTPLTEGVNAFTFSWAGENNWLCPPISLISSTISHMRICKCQGTLLVPIWPSAPYWPLIYSDGIAMATFVKDFYVIYPEFTSPVRNTAFKGKTKFGCIALKISFV